MSKKCTKCGEVKPLDEFGRNRGTADGLQYWCKVCRAERASADREHKAEYDRAYRAVNAEHIAEYKRAWIKANPKKRAEYTVRKRAAHPDRVVARRAVSNAIRDGKIPPARDLPCSVCGVPAQQYHHHLGYSPQHRLDVVAVCIPCHVELDKEVN